MALHEDIYQTLTGQDWESWPVDELLAFGCNGLKATGLAAAILRERTSNHSRQVELQAVIDAARWAVAAITDAVGATHVAAHADERFARFPTEVRKIRAPRKPLETAARRMAGEMCDLLDSHATTKAVAADQVQSIDFAARLAGPIYVLLGGGPDRRRELEYLACLGPMPPEAISREDLDRATSALLAAQIPGGLAEVDDSWICSRCATVVTYGWDRELQETTGLPAFAGVDDDGNWFTVCDACFIPEMDLLH